MQTDVHLGDVMSYVMVDVESDGPIPGDYSMICFGAIVVEPSLERTFYGKLKPVSEKWISEALAVSGFTREETLGFDSCRQHWQHDPFLRDAADLHTVPHFLGGSNDTDTCGKILGKWLSENGTSSRS